MKAFFGTVELENGLVIRWLRFASSADEAVRIVAAQHTNVVRCLAD